LKPIFEKKAAQADNRLSSLRRFFIPLRRTQNSYPAS